MAPARKIQSNKEINLFSVQTRKLYATSFLFCRVRLRRSNTVSHKEKPEMKAGSQVNVCLDCKDMILQIIRTQRATRRQQFTKSLCFN